MFECPIFRANVQALCDSRGVPNPIQGSDVAVSGIVFWGPDGPVPIPGTPMNLASRLWFQDLAENKIPRCSESISSRLEMNPQLLALAEEFFAELWHHEPGQGTHALLDALREAKLIDLEWQG